MDKKVLRKEILEKRSLLKPDEIELKSQEIKNKLFSLDDFKRSNFIFSFISFKNEVHTHDIIKDSIAMDKRVGVPITVDETRKLLVSEIIDFDRELEIGYYNILTPKENFKRIVPPQLVDLVLVPGLAFDKYGFRVGYGGGYYDRFFASLNKDIIKIGLCYHMQILPEVPIDSYDIPVDYIITEKEIIQPINKKSK